MENNNLNTLAIPAAIIIAGVIVAIAIIFGGGNIKVADTPTDAGPKPIELGPTGATGNYREITSRDHIVGNPNASIKIIEYSDFECPFCQRFHNTMNSLMDDIGPNGDVAWVFRHFPIDGLHPKNARKVAVASECANELGGNEAFWSFINGWFDLALMNDRTNFESVVTTLVGEIGLDEASFDECLASGRYDEYVKADEKNAIETGGGGTPWSIIVTSNGKTFPLEGAMPKNVVERLIELAREVN